MSSYLLSSLGGPSQRIPDIFFPFSSNKGELYTFCFVICPISSDLLDLNAEPMTY